MKLQILILSDN